MENLCIPKCGWGWCPVTGSPPLRHGGCPYRHLATVVLQGIFPSLESSINPVNSKTRAGCGSEHIHHCLRTEGANCSALSLLGQGWEHLLWAVTGAAKGPQPQPGQLLASRCLYCVKPGLGCCWESVGRSIHREIATFCLKLGHEKLVIDRIIASFLIPTAKIQVEEPINLLTETF